MTNGIANDTYLVLRYFLGVPNLAGPIADDRARDAIHRVAADAFKQLSAGLRVDELDQSIATYVASRTSPASAIDGAMHSVWLHGDWHWLTSSMTTEERDAAADAVLRFSRELNGDIDEIDTQELRWWR